MAAGYKYYGFNRGEYNGQTGIWYREWAPGAKVRVALLRVPLPYTAMHRVLY